MKEELYTILAYLEHEEDEILITRSSIWQLDISQTNALEDKIEHLYELIEQSGIKKHDFLGYYYLFLGCIYYEKGEYDNVALSLQRANPELWKSQINKALAHWLLGINYSQMKEYPKAQEELKDALNILRVNTLTNSYLVEEQQQLKIRIRDRITQAITNLNEKSAHYVSPQSRIQGSQKPPNIIDKIKPFFTPSTPQPERTPYEQPPDKKSENSLKNKLTSEPRDNQSNRIPPTKYSSTVHITIPVDIDALENAQSNSAHLTSDLFTKLKNFNKHVGDNIKETIPAMNDKSEIYIPSFQIFGQVTAGLQGEPYLEQDPIEYADKVNESLRVNFGGKEHKVNFINNIKPSFADGKKYGWLSVKGKSMNNATGNPIDDKDYVLFCENHNAESCNGKIVVAFLSEFDDKLLIVKRLIKLSADTPFTRNGYSSKIKYILQSESLLNNDPETGISYGKDLEIKNNYQLVGEVIAIAHIA